MHQNDYEISQIPEIQEDLQAFMDYVPILDGLPIKDRAGITDEEILQLHATACYFFEKGKLNEAELFFRQLCVIDASKIDYVLGLGAVLQRKKLYAKAVDVYALAHIAQTNDSRPMFYAGQCHFFDRKYVKAKICFEEVIKNNYSAELSKMAGLFLEAIEKGKSND